MFKRYIAMFLVVFLIPLSTAYANEPREEGNDWYIGASMYHLNINVGQNNFEREIVPTKYEGVGVNIGVVPFHDIFGVAGSSVGFEFSIMEDGHENSASLCISEYCATGASKLKFRLWTVDTIVSFPFPGNQFSAFGSAGIGYIEYDAGASINYTSPNSNGKIASASKSGDGIAPSIGIGIEYRPSGSNLSTKLKYTNFTTLIKDDNSADMLSLTLNYHF